MLKKVCFFLIAVLAFNFTAAAKDPSEKKSKEKKEKTVSIAMFIPGVQQLKSGKYVKGSLFLGTFIGTVAGTFTYNKKGNDWYDKYRNSTNVDDIIRFREEAEKSFKKRNLFIAGIFTLWLAHIIDLKFIKTKKGGVKGEIGKNNFNIGFYYSF